MTKILIGAAVIGGALLLLWAAFGTAGVGESVARHLEGKYGEAFVVHDTRYLLDIDTYRFDASPVARPEIRFSGDYHGDRGTLSDTYREALLRDGAEAHIGALLERTYPRSAHRVGAGFSGELDGNSDFADLLEAHPKQLSVIVHLYLFEDLAEDNAEEVLAGIIDLVNGFVAKKVEQVTVFATFWDEARFANEKLEQFRFGFNLLGADGFEKTHGEFFRKQLRFRTRSGAAPLTVGSLLPLVTTERSLEIHTLR